MPVVEGKGIRKRMALFRKDINSDNNVSTDRESN